jgi:hypothetical protein
MKADPNAANVAQIARAFQMVTTALYSLAFTLPVGDCGRYTALAEKWGRRAGRD